MRLPETAPATIGWKERLILQLEPLGIGDAQVSLSVNPVGKVMLETVNGASPWLVIVTDCAALVVPVGCVPKARVVFVTGARRIAGGVAGVSTMDRKSVASLLRGPPIFVAVGVTQNGGVVVAGAHGPFTFWTPTGVGASPTKMKYGVPCVTGMADNRA